MMFTALLNGYDKTSMSHRPSTNWSLQVIMNQMDGSHNYFTVMRMLNA